MKTYIAAFVLALLLAGTASAQTSLPPPPEWLMQAIVLHESGGNPLALNVGGKSVYPDSVEEATRIILEAENQGIVWDASLAMINCQWPRRWNFAPEKLLDPSFNLDIGRKILALEIQRHGLNWRAVGYYHSPDPERGRQYAWRIYQTALRHGLYPGGQ